MAKKKGKKSAEADGGPKVDADQLRKETRTLHIQRAKGACRLDGIAFPSLSTQEVKDTVLSAAKKSEREVVNFWIQQTIATRPDELLSSVEDDIRRFDFARENGRMLLDIQKSEIKDLDECLATAVGEHSQRLQLLEAIQNQRMRQLQNHFEESMAALKEVFASDLQEMQDNQNAFKKQLQNVIAQLSKEEATKAHEETVERGAEYEALLNRSIESQHQMKSILDQKTQRLRELIDSGLQRHRAATAKNSQEYKELVEKDAQLAAAVLTRERLEEKIQQAISRWRAKSAQNKEDFEQRNAKMKRESEQLRSHCKALKDEMEEARALQHQVLSNVATVCRESRRRLLDQLALADKIHRMADLCRKYETEDEAIGDFGTTEPLRVEDVSFDESQKDLKEKIKDAMEFGDSDDLVALEGFFKKLNKVVIDVAMLERYLHQSRKSNREAEGEIQKHLQKQRLPEKMQFNDGPLTVSRITPLRQERTRVSNQSKSQSLKKGKSNPPRTRGAGLSDNGSEPGTARGTVHIIVDEIQNESSQNAAWGSA